MENNEKLPGKIAYAPGISNAVLQFTYSVSGSYFTFFITDICMLSALVMGSISFVSSIATLISIFIWGAVFQYSNTKSGRYRPWIMPIMICVFAGYAVMYYNWGLSQGLWAALIIAGYSLANIGVSGIGVASYGLTAKLGKTEDERSRMVSFQNLTHIIARIASTAIILPIIIFVGGSRTAPEGYFAYFAGFSFLAVFGYYYLYRVTKPYDIYDPNFKSSTRVTPADMFKALGSSPKLLIFFLSEVVYELLYLCKTFGMVYFVTYICGDLTDYAIYTALNPIGGLAGAAIASSLIKAKAEKIKLSAAFFSLQIATFAAAAVLAYSGSISTVVFISIILTGDFANSAQRATLPIFYMDLAEYTYAKTDKDVTPIVMALANVPFKFAFGASAGIVGLVLANTGYIANAVQTAAAQRGIIFAVCILPVIGIAQFCIMLLTVYKLNKETVAQIYAENAEKRAAAG